MVPNFILLHIKFYKIPCSTNFIPLHNLLLLKSLYQNSCQCDMILQCKVLVEQCWKSVSISPRTNNIKKTNISANLLYYFVSAHIHHCKCVNLVQTLTQFLYGDEWRRMIVNMLTYLPFYKKSQIKMQKGRKAVST